MVCYDTGNSWGSWCATTAVATTTESCCWKDWVATPRSYSNCDTSSVVWTTWNTDGTATNCSSKWAVTGAGLVSGDRAEHSRSSAEVRAKRARLDAEVAELRRRQEEEQKTADARAEELLLSALDEEQKAEYRKDKSFHVRNPKSGRRYRIRRAWSGHVERIGDHGRPVERLCAHPRVQVPLPDNQLIAKLMIETDEDQFRRLANVTPMPG